MAEKSSGAQAGFFGSFWFAGWLFTIAFAQLGFWQAVWAIVVWPYYFGDVLRLLLTS